MEIEKVNIQKVLISVWHIGSNIGVLAVIIIAVVVVITIIPGWQRLTHALDGGMKTLSEPEPQVQALLWTSSRLNLHSR